MYLVGIETTKTDYGLPNDAMVVNESYVLDVDLIRAQCRAAVLMLFRNRCESGSRGSAAGHVELLHAGGRWGHHAPQLRAWGIVPSVGNGFVGWLVGWSVGWLVGQLVGWLVSWLVGCCVSLFVLGVCIPMDQSRCWIFDRAST